MHLYLVTRGIKDRTDRWVNDCLARYYDYKCGEVAGKPIVGRLQLSMRPIQLYEVVFPEEHLNQVISDLQPYGGYGLQEGFIKKLVSLLRRMLKLEDIPKGILPNNTSVFSEGVDVFCVGMKKDKMIPVKREDL